MRSHIVVLHKPDLYKTNDRTFHILLFMVFNFYSLLRVLVMSSELVNIRKGLLAVYGRVKVCAVPFFCTVSQPTAVLPARNSQKAGCNSSVGPFAQ